MTYEQDQGVTHDWNSTLRTGNLVRSDLVKQCMDFVREGQKKAEIEVPQTSAVLHGHHVSPAVHTEPLRQDSFTQDIAPFTAAFSTTKRGDGPSRTLLQRILRLPNECGFLFNFQRGNTMRDGTDHLMTVKYDNYVFGHEH